jgi:hypothetical protein
MAAIAKYKVGVLRAVRGGPVRWLTLLLEGAATSNLREVSVFFYEGPAPNFGFINRKSGIVVANLKLADFEDAYRIVQTEKPVFVHWTTDPDEEKLMSFDLSTSEEPLGEGTPDVSP